MLESLFTHEQLSGLCMESVLQFGAREENQTTRGKMLRAMLRKKTTMTTASKTTNTLVEGARSRHCAIHDARVKERKRENKERILVSLNNYLKYIYNSLTGYPILRCLP